jgi:uncharacterized protein YodC (DUF2158 family)
MVKLNTASPKMSVHSAERNFVVCHWFVKDILQIGKFHKNQLIPATPEYSELEYARRLLFVLGEASVASRHS